MHFPFNKKDKCFKLLAFSGGVGSKGIVRANNCEWYAINHTFFIRFYLFIFREIRRAGEREGENHQCVVAPCAPTRDLACNPGIHPRLGIEPATLWFTGQHSIH